MLNSYYQNEYRWLSLKLLHAPPNNPSKSIVLFWNRQGEYHG